MSSSLWIFSVYVAYYSDDSRPIVSAQRETVFCVYLLQLD